MFCDQLIASRSFEQLHELYQEYCRVAEGPLGNLWDYNACSRGRYPTSERPRSLSRQNDLGRYLARTTLRHNV